MSPQIRTSQVRDGEIKRGDLNVSEAGAAVIRRILPGSGVSLTSTGADSGTGDVTVAVVDSRPLPPTGRIVTPNASFAAANTIALAANTLIAIPLPLPNSTTFTAIVSEVTTLVAANYRVGIYNSNAAGNYPTTLIAGSDVGLISAAAAGVKPSAFASTLAAGKYWIVFNASAAITMRGLPATAYQAILGAANVVGLGQATVYTSALAFAALPTTFPAGATAASPVSIPTAGLLV
jgi:hypothetical protein